ncbi:hypothetical protein NEPAR06_2129 [Nematocida parisii]|uniref:Uncharacterized protein n=1 Tax=Nematocida parisii (strain ERTm3) TaxID=935791 RepID=I3EJU4_NEMP3|nr:uncharacterized protein NEPG_00982 [Nematocida parisii ERTm1]EIJ89491.1 hypothetical protein NEQG_00261 [Nematocida parisii ERTm3]EIJ94314.1 hypothetical protein NEPG_00982 [Nematocida parisii ERTm1]KAI5156091.1 hypothetical protein NEPAR06_2129 [Nematocida parisii]KAI5158688.1 hypothetical protein NEPAR05_2214 [Nematocida parisii]|eukprot:XP_013058810.1 hypothetical protein NEPG_00982 [Nematocida parisii ERTm1]
MFLCIRYILINPCTYIMDWSSIKKFVLDTILRRTEINEEVQPNRIRYLRRNPVVDRPTSTYNRMEQPTIHSSPNIPSAPPLYEDNDLPSYTEAVNNYEQPPPTYNALF